MHYIRNSHNGGVTTIATRWKEVSTHPNVADFSNIAPFSFIFMREINIELYFLQTKIYVNHNLNT